MSQAGTNMENDGEEHTALKQSWLQATSALELLIKQPSSDGITPSDHVSLKVELDRLYLWGECIGLPHGSIDQRLDLRKMARYLIDAKVSIRKATQTPSLPEPSVWKSTRTPEAIKMLLQELETLQRQLRGFLTAEERKELRERSREMGFKLVLANDATELEIIENAIKALGPSNQEDKELEHLAQIRRRLVQLQTSFQQFENTCPRGSSAVLPAENLGNLYDQEADTTLGTYDDEHQEHVYVEWKMTEREQTPAARRAISRRVQDLASILDSPEEIGLNVLSCLGVVIDQLRQERQYGFVYRLPPQTRIKPGTQFMPFSLYNLLGTTFAPSLSARVGLARNLAMGLVRLHAIGWLHKCIKSEHVLFFPENLSQRSLDNPRMVGLSYARKDTEKDKVYSEKRGGSSGIFAGQDLYSHPEYQGKKTKPFIKAFDWYALGITLFEIGRWRRVEDLYKLRMTKANDALDIENFRNSLLNEECKNSLMKELKLAAGDLYSEAVRACLCAGPQDNSKENDQYIVLTMLREVVRPLESCII